MKSSVKKKGKEKSVKRKTSKVFYVVNYFLYGAPLQSTDLIAITNLTNFKIHPDKFTEMAQGQ